MREEIPENSKEFVDWVLAQLGIKISEIDILAQRIGFKSLRRARNGEIQLTPDRRQHLMDLVVLQRNGIQLFAPPDVQEEGCSSCRFQEQDAIDSFVAGREEELAEALASLQSLCVRSPKKFAVVRDLLKVL